MSFKSDVEDFLLYCELTKQYSPNTVRNYRNTLNRMVEFFETKKIENTEDVDMKLVNQYRVHLNQKITIRSENMSLRAQGYQIIVLRSLLKFLIKHGSKVMSPDSLELPKARMRDIQYLSEDEVYQLAASIINDPSKIPEVQKKRNQALVLCMFGSGLRLSEVLSLQRSDVLSVKVGDFYKEKDIDLDGVDSSVEQIDGAVNSADKSRDEEESQGIVAEIQSHPISIKGKGGKVRTTFLAPAAKESIEEYLKLRGMDDCPHLFISFSKNRSSDSKKWKALTPRMVQMILQKYANRLGIYKHITPHTLRHSFATKVLFAGGDLRSVQTLLGHSNIATTQIYTHITDNQIRDLHTKVFGNNKNNPSQNH